MNQQPYPSDLTDAQWQFDQAADRLLVSRDEAAVTLWALTEPELFTTYTAWNRTTEQYETWLGSLLVRSLLR